MAPLLSGYVLLGSVCSVGILLQAQTASLVFRHKGDNYLLNLIDTPGHVDFSYEVSRSLAAVSGAVLLVDAAQGIQVYLHTFALLLAASISFNARLCKMPLLTSTLGYFETIHTCCLHSCTQVGIAL